MKKMMLIVTFFALQSAIQFAVASPGGSGFIKIDDPAVPAKVQKARDSVLQIFITPPPLSDKRLEVDITDERMLAKIQEALKAEGFDQKETLIINQFINSCRRHGEEKKCSIPLEIKRGTAFYLEENGNAILTNAHMVSELWAFSQQVASLQPKIKAKFDEQGAFVGWSSIFLFNNEGKLVFDSTDDGSNTKIYLPPASTRISNDFFDLDNDYVKIIVTKKLTVPTLKIATNMPARDENLFLVGYPYCTGCKPLDPSNEVQTLDFMDRGSNKNSDGQSLYVSIGHLLDANSILKKDSASLAAAFKESRFIMYDADSQGGNSGGPILNSDGEVIGIHTGGGFVKSGPTYNRESRGIKLVNLQAP